MTGPTTDSSLAATMAEANREFFDDMASKYEESEINRESMARLSREMVARLDWIGAPWLRSTPDTEQQQQQQQPVRLLDYACGTGLVSYTLAPYVSAVRGIDLSAGMLAEYRRRGAEKGYDAARVRAVQGDLLGDAPVAAGELATEEAEWFGFDVATVGLGFHHFADPVRAVRRLAERLRPGGVLLITEFEGDMEKPRSAHDHYHHHHHGGANGHAHGHASGHGDEASGKHEATQEDTDKFFEQADKAIKAHGYSRDDIRRIFGEGGLVDVDVDPMEGVFAVEFGKRKFDQKLYFAKGRKPA